MVPGSLRWTEILGCCDEAFKREPALEAALGGVYREVFGKYATEQTARRFRFRGSLKGAIYPYFFLARSLLLRYDLERLTVARGDGAPGAVGVFVITESRDNNFGCIYPVLRRFDELGHPSLLFVSDEAWVTKRQELRALRHCRIVLMDLLKYISGPRSGFDVRRWMRELVGLYDGCCEDERVRAFVRDFRPFLGYETMDLLHTAGAVEQVLRGVECRFILTMGVPPGEFRWALAGKRLGIRTYVVSHGFVETHKLPVHYSPSNSDEIILWGGASEPLVRQVCGPDHAVSVLGNPAFDILVSDRLAAPKDPAPLLPLGYRPNARTLVFFSGTHAIRGDPAKHVEPIKALKQLKRRFANQLNVVVKLHPHERADLYREHLGPDLGRFIIVKHEIDLYRLIRLADVAASLDSTTLLESMLFKVPTLQLALTEQGVEADYHKHGAARLVRSEEELVGLVDAILKGDDSLARELRPGQERYVAQYLVNLGSATESFVEHLLAPGGGKGA